MDQQIINLYDEYTHRPLSRQDFLKRLAILAGGTAAALTILPLLESNYAKAAITSNDDLFTEYVKYPGVPNEMTAYVARPKEQKKYPAVVVIHENRGLTPHIEDVARRAANAGYLAIAPNALSALGKTPANEDEARQLFTTLKAEDNLQIASLDSTRNQKINRLTFSRDYLEREKALARLTDSNPIIQITTWFLILFFILVDILPVTWKALTKKGPYDDRLNLLETIASNETQQKKIDSDTELSIHKRMREREMTE